MDHQNIINIAIKNVPRELVDDAKQAGYVGLLNGLKRIGSITNKNGYLYRCVTNEIIREMGSLQRPFALNRDTFLKLVKYKKLRNQNLEHTARFNIEPIRQLHNIMGSENKELLLDG